VRTPFRSANLLSADHQALRRWLPGKAVLPDHHWRYRRPTLSTMLRRRRASRNNRIEGWFSAGSGVVIGCVFAYSALFVSLALDGVAGKRRSLKPLHSESAWSELSSLYVYVRSKGTCDNSPT
jgi:hypothetical protein